MRNRNKINQLGRTASHRDALMMNLASALIQHKRISTTVAKAKALRGYVEPLITKSKNDTTHSRRMVFRHLKNKEAVTELFREVAAKVGERPGGYTRIIKTGFRPGDSAEMCMIELVDFNEIYTNDSGASKTKKTRRSRRGSGGSSSKEKSGDAPKTEAKKEPKEEAVEKVEEPKPEVKEEPKAEASENAEANKEEPTGESIEEPKSDSSTNDENEKDNDGQEKKSEN
ncbi:MAG: 50S ribosomal protein L17 [Salibacteraceae bacterium]